MKRSSKKLLSIFLAALLCFSCCTVCAFAEDEVVASGSFSVLNYNIDGLPFKDTNSKKATQTALGKVAAATGANLVCVQEDFDLDSYFSKGLNYAYRTAGSASFAFGDGLNIFSKGPVYNVSRQKWNVTGGQLWEGDVVSQKGILFSVVQLADGIFADVYVLHADAYGGASSTKARESNFDQLAAMIKGNENDGRAVIVTGDFNSSIHTNTLGETGESMYRQLCVNCGLKDSWCEVINKGNYTDYSSYTGSYWGNWDSAEHVLYKDGVNVSLTATSHKYATPDASTGAVSDHVYELVSFDYSATNTTDAKGLTAAAKTYVLSPAKWFSIVYTDLSYIFSHWSEVEALIQHGNDMDYLYAHYST